MKQVRILFSLVLFLCVLYYISPVFAENPEDTTPSGIPISELEVFVDGYMENYIGITSAGAGIVIMKNGEVVLSKGYGYSDIENKIKINPNKTIFEWASVSKTITWAAVMQMVEQGKIDLNEDIRTYLPTNFLTKLKYDEPITMLHLMHHNAGFEEWNFDLGYQDPTQLNTLEKGLKIAEPTQVYRPGEVVAYSNFSTALAGYIVERVSGQAFDEYVDENIFTPLGMNTAEYNTANNSDKAKGYALVASEQFQEYRPFYMSLYPAGGINGTTEDLAKFAATLLSDENSSPLLFKNPETLRTFLSPSYTVPNGMIGNAHGFWEYKGNYRGITHAGNTDSFSSNLHVVPEENFAVVITANQAGDMNTTFGLTEALVGDKSDLVKSKELTDVDVLEGLYITARREHSSFINLYYYLMLLHVKPLSENEIEVNLAGMKSNYVQTGPNLYEMTDGHDIFLAMKELYFHVDDGVVTRISVSMNDFLPLAPDRSIPILITHAILFILCSLYFLITPFVIFIKCVRNRKKKVFTNKSTKWNALLNLSGFVILSNIISLIVRMLSNASRPYSNVTIHFIINYIFTGVIAVSITMLILSWKKEDLSKTQKVFYVISIIQALILVFMLVHWQLFH